MFLPTNRESQVLTVFGETLRRMRIEHKLCQAGLAEQIGVSIPTYRRMEKGSPGVPVGYWIRVMFLLDQEEVLGKLVEEDGSSRCQSAAKLRQWQGRAPQRCRVSGD